MTAANLALGLGILYLINERGGLSAALETSLRLDGTLNGDLQGNDEHGLDLEAVKAAASVCKPGLKEETIAIVLAHQLSEGQRPNLKLATKHAEDVLKSFGCEV